MKSVIRNTAFLLGISLCLGLAACSNATQSEYGAWGQSHHIKQFSGGKLIEEWDSTGAVSNEDKSDGKYFQDVKTGKLVDVSGDIQITVNQR